MPQILPHLKLNMEALTIEDSTLEFDFSINEVLCCGTVDGLFFTYSVKGESQEGSFDPNQLEVFDIEVWTKDNFPLELTEDQNIQLATAIANKYNK